MTRILLLIIIIGVVGGAHAQTRKYGSFKKDFASYSYAYFLPDEYDTARTYPVIIGPGEGTERSTKCYLWDADDPGRYGWILVEFPFWKQNSNVVESLLKELNRNFKVEGDKFHIVGFSTNSHTGFGHTIANPEYFHSVTGIPGYPPSRNIKQIEKLKGLKVQIIVGEKDTPWIETAREFDEVYKELGISSTLEIIKGGGHKLTDLVGEEFIQRMERMRN